MRPNGRCELEKETRACGVVSRRKLSSRMQKSIAITIHNRQAGRWNIWCSLVETERIAQPDIVEGRVSVARRAPDRDFTPGNVVYIFLELSNHSPCNWKFDQLVIANFCRAVVHFIYYCILEGKKMFITMFIWLFYALIISYLLIQN